MWAADATKSHRTWTTRATGPQATEVPRGPTLASRTGRECDHHVDDPEDWLLSAEERGNPHTELPARTAGNLATPLLHGTTYFDRPEVEDLDEGDHLFFTDWRGDPRPAAEADGTDRGAAVHRRGSGGDRARPGLALAHGPGLDEQGGEPRARRRDRAQRRRGDPRPADPRWAVTTRSSSSSGTTTIRRGMSRSSAGSTSATAAGTTPSTTATRSRCRCAGRTASGRRGTTCSWRCGDRGVHALDTVFRERWDDPNSPDEDHPIAWIHDKLHHTRLHADPLPDQPRRRRRRDLPSCRACARTRRSGRPTSSPPTASGRWRAVIRRRSSGRAG